MAIPPLLRYRIQACCPENGSAINSFININGVYAGDGVYNYTGANVSIPGTDVNLVNGSCYTITDTLELLAPLELIDASDLTFIIAGRCDDPLLPALACPDCTPTAGNYYIKAESCCGGDPIFFKGEGYTGGIGDVKDPGGQLSGSQQPIPSIPQFSLNNFAGVYLFNGFVSTQQAQIITGLEIGQCYTFSTNSVTDPSSEITLAEYNALGYPPYISQLTDVDKTDCNTLDEFGKKICPECEEICYRLTSCTGIIINTVIDLSLHVGTYVELVGYTGSWYVQINNGICQDPTRTLKILATGATPCPCLCYEVIGESGGISYIDCDGVSQYTYGPAKFCAQSPPLIKGTEGVDYTLITGIDCVDGECIDKCFLLTNCDPTAWPLQDATLDSTLQSLSQYANTSEVVVLSGYDGCWTVTEKNCSCLTITIDGTPIEALATGTHNSQSVFSFKYNTIPYYIWFNSGWFVTFEVGNFASFLASTESTTPCPIFGSFDDPVTPDPAGWRSNPEGQIITTVLCADQCDCPVDVTVIRDYTDCEDCLGITAYKLTNCEKINEVVYSIQDLSAFVGQVIKDDCNCWTVEEIDYQPPSETTIVDPILYTDCTTCLTTYYTLTDCDDSESVIISSTNLSAFVGQVVKLEGCNPCYEVALYTETVAPALWEEVTVTEASATCFDCKQLVPRCSTVFNNSTADRIFTYIDANGDSQETEIIKSGHFSLRYCVQYWDEPDTFIYNYHGDCTVYENPNAGLPGECNCFQINVQGTEGPVLNILANHTGEFYNGKKVYDLVIDGIDYHFWSTGVGGHWYITQELGVVGLDSTLGEIQSGFPDCPEAPSGAWTPGRLPPGTASDAVVWMESNLTDCSPHYEGFCVQYFPNDRKVRPGYNTPICSADKYDKITCNAADIMYKKALELRYGISDCCPEENEKWLIKKELIELQALTDPNYICNPLTDCCGQPTSSCSCNS